MGEDDPEQNASASSDDYGPAKTCDNCERPIETSDWYPVTSERDGEGSLRLYHFCSEECHDAWRDDRPE